MRWRVNLILQISQGSEGEVGILGTVLLRVYSRTTFAIFVEIGLYLTDRGVRNPMKISDIGFLKTEPNRPQN